jgi:hypothetical protein
VGNDDQTGPLLLEDHFAREKVSAPFFTNQGSSTNTPRSTASTMSAFPSVLFTPVAPAPLESSPSSSPPRTLHQPAFLPTHPARPPSSYDSRLCWAAAVLQTLSVMSVVSLSNSTPRRATGTLLETTFPSSSSRTR